ncbi:MAG: hypothetical protein DMF87_16640 [Acidobacteria bacterium]|nr:MAG: hypothetical protein DMF87_16640 [Acidobacteriota bacterium]
MPQHHAKPRRAILVRRQGVGIDDMSRTGCHLESKEPLGTGSVGILAVNIDGQTHIEFFRVARSSQVPDGDARYQAGVEFLPMPAETASLHDIIGQFDQSDAG